MKLLGNYFKDGKFWIAETPFVNFMDQDRSKSECLAQISSAIEELINVSEFDCSIQDLGNGEFVLSSENTKLLSCFILKRLREAEGISIREMSKRLGIKSRQT